MDKQDVEMRGGPELIALAAGFLAILVMLFGWLGYEQRKDDWKGYKKANQGSVRSYSVGQSVGTLGAGSVIITDIYESSGAILASFQVGSQEVHQRFSHTRRVEQYGRVSGYGQLLLTGNKDTLQLAVIDANHQEGALKVIEDR